jgi:WD40 repeat protein
MALFDPTTGSRLAGPTEVQPGIVSTTAFSPDGRTLLIAGADGLTRLWQPAELQPLAPPLFPADDVGRVGAFSADGAHILVIDVTGRLSVWDARPQAWLQRACSIANRDFTPEERVRYAITADTSSPCP